MEQILKEIEEKNGVRFTWNVFPTKGEEVSRIPLACMYNVHQQAPTLNCEPIICYTCKAILNPHCQIDFGRQSWSCTMCNNVNSLPNHARDITPENLLPELMEENSTIEYVLSKDNIYPLVFFFVVDVCTFDDQRLDLLKDALEVTLDSIPGDSLIGFIQYGTNIELYKLYTDSICNVVLLSGKPEYSKNVLSSISKTHGDLVGKFVRRKDECEEVVRDLIRSIKKDPFPVPTAHKPLRCTGSALSLAFSLMESSFPDTGVKYLLFTQGPCTLGPGSVASTKYKEKGKIEHIEDNDPIYTLPAQNFYTSLATRMSDAGHSVDILSATIVDIGIAQMEKLVSITGGMLVMAQDFDHAIYTSSCKKLMESSDGVLKQGFNCKMQVKTSPNLAFEGMVGMGKSSAAGWRIGSIFPSSNITLLISPTKEAKHEEFAYLQIVSKYQRSDRRMVIRCTTVARMYTDNKNDAVNSFDQEAVAVFQARFLLLKNYEEVRDCERMIDKNLIKFTRHFSNYTRGVDTSLVLPESMSYYPNYMFFFRRSLLVQTDNNSHDETSYYRHLLYKERMAEALKLIKPTLFSFNCQGDITPVELDTTSLSPDVILLLDTFHNVLVWRGSYVAQWIKEGYHTQEEYSYIKDMIEKSESMALGLCDRLPTPQYCITEENKSQQRILYHFVNPSTKGVVITENISYEKFFEALSKVVVTGED